MYLIFFFLDIIDYEQTTRLEIESSELVNRVVLIE